MNRTYVKTPNVKLFFPNYYFFLQKNFQLLIYEEMYFFHSNIKDLLTLLHVGLTSVRHKALAFGLNPQITIYSVHYSAPFFLMGFGK